MNSLTGQSLILVTGATGYVGSRLVRALEDRGMRVRCAARDTGRLKGSVAGSTEVVEADVLRPEFLQGALEGVDTAYYLVHSMAAGGSFEERDRRGASHFAEAARRAGLRRIIYLGGLVGGGPLSPHLASRVEVGRILRESGVSTLEFRASIIIGSGSLSFQMVRALVDRLPVMVTPRWTRNLAQPIGIDDVIAYLLAGMEIPGDESRVIEIGGADIVSYRGIMEGYARQSGLRRLIIPVPVLTPWLSSLWLGLVTPLHARIGRELIEGVRNDSVVADSIAGTLFPGIHPVGITEAIGKALQTGS